MEMEMGCEGGEREIETQMNKSVFRDIRRYYCDFCGISRSKKPLLSSHIASLHKDEMNQTSSNAVDEKDNLKSNACQECGATFRKPSHLKQHMLSHSLERPFKCSVDDCPLSYRRKDHLNRHLLQHQGKLFECPDENCHHKFSYQGNMKRHVHEFHDNDLSSSNNSQKQHVCLEDGCGKVFKYASKLRTHETSHVKLNSVEVYCLEPGCMKPFTNKECLKAHIESSHQYINCEICGNTQLKKNIKRHLRTHGKQDSPERIKCSIKDCLLTFSNRSNLQQHVKAVHLSLRPFTCSVAGCEMRFSFKHVRDKHEKTACHVYTHGDFEETDEQIRSRPRGGQKRKFPTVETLTRKRVISSNLSDSIFNQGSEFLSWMLSAEDDDQ